MDAGSINDVFPWIPPFLALLATALCLVLFFKIGKQRDKLYQERNALYDFVHDVSEAFVKTEKTQIDFLLERVLFYAQRTSMAGAGAIYFEASNGEEFIARAVSGLFPPIVGGFDDGVVPAENRFQKARKLVEDQPALRGQGLVGEVIERAAPVLIEDAELDPRVQRFEDEFFRIRSIILAPMRFHNTVMGVLVLINRIDDEPFIQSDLSLLQSLSDQASVTIYFARFSEELAEKRLLDRDLQVAKKIQSSLLPARIPTIRGFELDAFTMPAGEIGGDYYDFVEIDEDHFGLTVADVCGRGVTGAIMMSICRSVFRANARTSTSPAHVLKTINDVISRDIYQDMFISMLYLVLNTRTHQIKIARAGHVYPFVVSADGLSALRIDSRGIAMGLADKAMFEAELEENVATLDAGDVFVAYTDGLVEMMGGKQEQWGVPRLQRTVQANAAGGASSIVDNARRDALAFAEGRKQDDDMTLVVMNRGK